MIFKKIMNSEAKSQDLKSDLEFKERLFFHDLINQTHGMLLFLTHKEVKKESLTPQDLNMVIKEIKTMQSLIKDHYQFTHKNLIETYSWVGVDIIESSLQGLINNFLGHAKIEIKKSLKTDFSQDSFIHFPTYYRVMNNIIKNIAESKSENISIELEFTSEKLKVLTVNEISKPLKLNESKKLEEVILSDKNHLPKSLGLDSISALCEEAHGEFNFEIKNGSWINEFSIPTRKHFTQVIGTKKSA